MADIAARIGVSRQLVSLVLRDEPGASEVTRARVRRAAEELGYRPHVAARSLRQRRSRHLGVAFVPGHPSVPGVVEGIYAEAAARGYQVLLSAVTRTRSTRLAVDELLGHRCAALVVVGSELSDIQMKAVVRRANVPVAWVGTGRRQTAFDVVLSGGAEGIAMAVAHLVTLGHRDLTYVHCESMPQARPRLDGYLRAMAEVGGDPDVLEVRSRDHTEESGAKAGRRLLRRGTLPTGVVCGNDQQAVGLLGVLSRAGVRVPADVSLTGFGDSRFASVSSVDLTTVREHQEELGATAVDAVLRRVDRASARPGLHVVHPALVVRGSTDEPRDDR